VGASPSAAAGRESLLYKVTALPEQAETALEAAFETALAPKITNYIVHDLEAAVKQDLEAYAADAKLQLTEVRTYGRTCVRGGWMSGRRALGAGPSLIRLPLAWLGIALVSSGLA
jgi:hypothetical protein